MGFARQIVLFDREKSSNVSHFYQIPIETFLGDGAYYQFLESDRKFDKKNSEKGKACVNMHYQLVVYQGKTILNISTPFVRLSFKMK